MSYARRRRHLFPSEIERIVREFTAERDRRVSMEATRYSRFKIGQRVGIVGSELHAIVSEVIPVGKRGARYRLRDRPFLYFESDLQDID